MGYMKNKVVLLAVSTKRIKNFPILFTGCKMLINVIRSGINS